MKKLMAIVLAALMVFSLFACGGSGSSTTVSSASASPSSAPSTAPAASSTSAGSPSSSAAATSPSAPASSKIGFYDSGIDYTKNKKYNVVYMVSAANNINQDLSDAFNTWASRANCSYTYYSSNNEADAYINTMQTYTDQKQIDGFILDPDPTIFSRIQEVCKELNISWISGMTPITDDKGNFAGPCSGNDQALDGALMANSLINYAKKTWSGEDPKTVGFLVMTFSAQAVFTMRASSIKECWDKGFPNQNDNYFVCDSITSGNPDASTAYNLISATIVAHPEIKHWLIATMFDDFAVGACRAVEGQNLDAASCVNTIGGSTLVKQWDTGYDGSWKFAIYTAQPLFSEPIFFGLYALMNKDATMETLWSEWISPGQKYAHMPVVSQVMTKENYKDYLECVDQYTGMDLSNYTYTGQQFTLHATPSASK
jgi:ABC-type sugar transport system substrate-binding protein